MCDIVAIYLVFLRMVLVDSFQETNLRGVLWKQIYTLSKKHKLDMMLYCFAKSQKHVPKELFKAYGDLPYAYIQRDIVEQNDVDSVKRAFESFGLPIAFLKGSVLKHDYPQSYMRFMNDIDTYIDTSYRDSINKCMQSLGAKYGGEDSGDIAYDMPSGIHIEFHGRLLYKKTNDGIVGYADNSRLLYDSSTGKSSLTEEGYALNLIGHMINNLATSGLGIRFIVDLWVYRNCHKPQPDWDAVLDQLDKDGIGKVARNLIELSECWFGNDETEYEPDMEEWSPLMREMTEYIFNSNLQGGMTTSAISRACFSTNGGDIGRVHATAKAIRYGIFRSKEEYINRYPWLKKYPFLLPMAWCDRLGNSIRKHPKEINRQLNQALSIDKEAVKEHRARLVRFGVI